MSTKILILISGRSLTETLFKFPKKQNPIRKHFFTLNTTHSQTLLYRKYPMHKYFFKHSTTYKTNWNWNINKLVLMWFFIFHTLEPLKQLTAIWLPVKEMSKTNSKQKSTTYKTNYNWNIFHCHFLPHGMYLNSSEQKRSFWKDYMSYTTKK